jgi:hypothetical protein
MVEANVSKNKGKRGRKGTIYTGLQSPDCTDQQGQRSLSLNVLVDVAEGQD